MAKNTEPPVWTIAKLDPLQFSVTYSGGDKTEGGDEPLQRYIAPTYHDHDYIVIMLATFPQ